jgi:hypothetical protein
VVPALRQLQARAATRSAWHQLAARRQILTGKPADLQTLAAGRQIWSRLSAELQVLEGASHRVEESPLGLWDRDGNDLPFR